MDKLRKTIIRCTGFLCAAIFLANQKVVNSHWECTMSGFQRIISFKYCLPIPKVILAPG